MSHDSAYPLIEHAADTLTAAGGRPLAEITPEAVLADDLSAADLQIDAETLRTQARLAHQAGYPQLAANLRRAAELTAVPNHLLLQMYEMLRPGRSTFADLSTLAAELETEYKAPVTARFVREAAAAYQTRRLLRQEESR